MSRALLIVESPAKCKSVASYAGDGATALASYGHLRDLDRKSKDAVHPDDDFRMDYQITDDHVRHVDAIVREAKKADIIYLASDLDREGEAIAYSVAEILKERGVTGKTIHRITFSEISKKAIQEAIKNPRQIDMNLVNAQMARRALDYLVGFNLSPVLWKKVRGKLSAGRVQSPALRLIAERDEAIEKFEPKEYWSITSRQCDRYSSGTQDVFQARLYKYKGTKVEQFTFTNEAEAMEAKATIVKAAQQVDNQLLVSNIISREKKRRPSPPFTTSTIQQEASRKLGFSSSRTMKIAQELYEGVAIQGEQVGIITYMRTDAVNLSLDFVSSLRDIIAGRYGANAIPNAPRLYTAKSKNAQEAHEAIRPTSSARSPDSIKHALSADQFKLYELIWKRTLACQMSDAIMATTTIEIDVPGIDTQLRSSGSVVVFPGFLSVYEEGRDDKDDDDESRKLPNLKVGEKLSLVAVNADQHFTEPPPSFNEASLVKTLEEYGIGRPSTYASIIQVLLNREYVKLEGKRFEATDIGRAVSRFLTAQFPKYVDYEFTANLEDQLDAISRGETPWLNTMREFWGPFKENVAKGMEASRDEAQSSRMLGTDPVSGKPIGVRLSRFGPVAFKGDHANKEVKLEFASLNDDQHIDRITLEQALELFQYPKTLGKHEGQDILVNRGKYGPHVVLIQTDGKKLYASIPEGTAIESVDLAKATSLLVEKKSFMDNRNIAELKGGIKVLNGSYGPYVEKDGERASIPKGVDPKSITAEEAIRLIEERKAAKATGGGNHRGKSFKKGGKGKWKGKDKMPKPNADTVDGLPM
jgi:DNA topoisomerase-1